MVRKIIVFILAFIIVCFSIPISLTKQFRKPKATVPTSTEITGEELNINIYNYEKYGKVKVLHTKTEQIEEMEIDEYLCGVVAAEMPVNFELEALKAQAIVARTYTIYKIMQNEGKHENADICDNSTCCQAWIEKQERFEKWKQNTDENISKDPEANWEKIMQAINSTKGKIIVYDGQPINAFFHSNSGGKTEIPINVWGGSGYPYLQTVETSGEDAYIQYSSEIIISKKNLVDKIKSKHNEFAIDFSLDNCISITENTEGGRVKTIKIGNLELSGVEVRNIIGLKSANFSFEIENDNIKFKTVGSGHGVGMSQTGADSLAKQGKNCEEIIKHFYSGVEIINM